MDEPADKPGFAWQPLTARGVAAFARAPFGRLWCVQLAFALIAGATVVWFLAEGWFPTIRTGIREMPSRGEIRSGQLSWSGDSPQRLAESRFLSVVVDLNHEGSARSPAHVQVEFGRSDFKIISLLGSLEGHYPKGWVVAFSRQELEPWFGAWAPAILAIAALAVVGGLMLSWAVLSTVYFLPAWLLGFFANRHLQLGGAWRLSGAALMPGCLFLTCTLVFYGLSLLDLVHVLLATALHLIVGWVYLVVGLLALPRHPDVAGIRPNPFAPGVKQETGDVKSET
jgi:hypothetical protein